MFVISVYAEKFENDRIEVYISRKADLAAKNFILEKEIVRFIDNAGHTLDIAVQELRSGEINKEGNPIKVAVLRAAERGVKVRLMLEKSYLKPGSDNLKTFHEFEGRMNIQVKSDKNPAIFHNKFVVRDHGQPTAALLTGSSNFTDTGTRRNYNHILIIHFNGTKRTYFEILDRYRDEFNEFWEGTFGNSQPDQDIPSYKIGNTTISVLFSPDNDPDDILIKKICGAEENLDVMMFTFSSNSPLMAGVINRFFAVQYKAHKPTNEPKVSVRVAMEGVQCRYWSAYGVFKKLGVPVVKEDTEAKLHHKVAVIDNKSVVLGSYNWTLAANDENDENVVILSSKEIARLFNDAFNEIWQDCGGNKTGTASASVGCN